MDRQASNAHVSAWLGCGLAGAVVHTFLWWVSEPRILFSDFHKAYLPAAESLWQFGPGVGWPLAETGVGGFVNLPVIGYLFVPLLFFGERGAAWAFLAFGAVLLLSVLVMLIRLRWLSPGAGAMWLFLVLANGPLVNSLKEGNTTHVVFALVVFALILWQMRSEYAAGLVLGFCAVIKPPLLLFGAYFLLRRRWRIVAGGAGMVLFVALLSVILFGLDANLGWYEDSVRPYIGGVIPALNVQSLDGFLIRLELGEQHLFDWSPHVPGLVHSIVRYVLFAGILAAAGGLIMRPRDPAAAPGQGRAMCPRDALEYCMVLNVVIVASPLSWTHYYVFLLLPFALYLSGRILLPDDATTRWLMRASMVLCSLPVVVLPMEPGWLPAVFARTAISAWLFGGLLSLAALMRGARQASAAWSARAEEVPVKP